MMLRWDEIGKDNSTVYQQLRFPGRCDHEIYYAIDPEGNRSILFYISEKQNNPVIRDTSFKNTKLEIKSIYSRTVLVLTLLNADFFDIFDDFISSIFLHLVPIKEEVVAINTYLRCYNKWAEFFQAMESALNEKDVMGIIGELLTFEYIINNSGYNAQDIVNSWKGPYGKGHDFEIDNKLIEVKCIHSNKDLIDISSEYQLDYLSHQALFLSVYKLELSRDVGTITISKMVRRIADFLRTQPDVNMEEFWRTLSKTGIGIKNMHEYDVYAYQLSSSLFYDARNPAFPSLKRSLLPDGLTGISYQLSLQAINDFILSNIF